LPRRSQTIRCGAIDIDWSDAVLVIPVRKKAISIRVVKTCSTFFKAEGDGYQRRINARAAFLHAAEGQAEKSVLDEASSCPKLSQARPP